MSAVPPEIAGVGSSAIKLRVSPGFDPLKAQVGPDEYFLLSRIDGSQTLREVILSTGLPIDRAIAIVTRLRAIGAVLLPGETTAPVVAPPPAPPAPPAPPPVAVPVAPPVAPPVVATAKRTPVEHKTAPIGTRSPLAATHTPAAAPPAQPLNPSTSSQAIAIPRTSTPMTPMAGGKLPARAATPPQGVPAITATPPRAATPPLGVPSIPAASAGSGAPAVSRTTTPSTPLPPSRMPAKPAPAIASPVPAPDPSALLPDASAVERAALVETCELRSEERVRILVLARLLDGRDLYALLGVTHGADARTLKRAYFKLSKEIHPDRFYGKQLGSFAERLNTVFEAVSRAYATLTQPDKSRASGKHQAMRDQPQTPQEYAAELFDRACSLEVGGDALEAMKLFAAAVRIDPQTRYLRRAASCALAAGQPKTGLEYAKKAQTQSPNDPSSARLLAAAFTAAGKYADAEEVLVMAMAIKSENDVLTAELRHDLAEVRRLLAG